LTLTGQIQPDLIVNDADLISIIEKWSQLSDELRNTIIKIIS
jgi:hypothetical protein